MPSHGADMYSPVAQLLGSSQVAHVLLLPLLPLQGEEMYSLAPHGKHGSQAVSTPISVPEHFSNTLQPVGQFEQGEHTGVGCELLHPPLRNCEWFTEEHPAQSWQFW